MKRILSGVFAVLCCCMLSGCYQKVTEGNDLVFSFQLWVPVLVAFLGLMAIPVGILLYRNKQVWGGLLAIFGPLATVVAAPGMFIDRVVVSQEGYRSRSGMWWNSSDRKIRYDDLKSVQITVEETIGRGGRKSYSYFFNYYYKSGEHERVQMGDLLRQALPDIVEQFKKHKLQVSLPPGIYN